MAKAFANSFAKHPVKFAVGAVINLGGLLVLVAQLIEAV